MPVPTTPIHAPLNLDPRGEETFKSAPSSAAPTPPPSRHSLLLLLDRCTVAGREHSLGVGGASSILLRAVEKALVDELADQLRGKPTDSSSKNEIVCWAAEIIEGFRERGEGASSESSEE